MKEFQVVKFIYSQSELKKDGGMLTPNSFNSGWEPISILKYEDEFILCLSNVNGSKAYWLFNKEREYLSNDLVKYFIGKKISDSFRNLLSIIIRTENAHDFLHMFEKVASKLIEADISLSTEPCIIKNLSERDSQDEMIVEYAKEKSVSLLDSYGNKVISRHSLVPSPMTTVYLYYNESGDLLYLSFWGGHLNKPIITWDFVNMTFFTELVKNEVKNYLENFISHIINKHKLITNYLNSKTEKLISCSVFSHLGHILWNDLTGLDRAKKNNLLNLIDELCFLRSDVFDVWLNIGKYLSISSNKIRKLGNVSIDDHIYTNKCFLVRLSDQFISKALTDAIKLDNSYPTYFSDNANCVKVTIGLRFENRTWLNQLRDLPLMVKMLASYFKGRKVELYIDGHNINTRGSGTKIKSFKEKEEHDVLNLEIKAYNQVFALEKELNIKVINGVDVPLSFALSHIYESDFFIAPWGAGLSKYKWCANLPGVIFTNKKALKSKLDLFIYEDGKYREGATKCSYVEESYIEDEAAITSIIEDKYNHRDNFQLDISGVIKALESKD